MLREEDEASKQPPPELTETEEAVKNYLERDDGLTNEILDSILLCYNIFLFLNLTI